MQPPVFIIIKHITNHLNYYQLISGVLGERLNHSQTLLMKKLLTLLLEWNPG